MKFSDTLNELDRISQQLKDQGITVENLNSAIADLKTHQGNIESIEENINAIKQEVIGPIQTELEQNKIAGRFSIFGFWVGALGLVVSIGTIFYQQGSSLPSKQGSSLPSKQGSSLPSKQGSSLPSKQGSSLPPLNSFQAGISNAEILKELGLIESQLLFPKGFKIEAGEIFVERSSRIRLASNGNKEIFVEAGSVIEFPKGMGLKSGVRIFLGSNQIGQASLEKALLRTDGKHGLREWYTDNEIGLAEGDALTIGNVKLLVVKIFSTNPSNRLIGDDKDGILIKISGGGST